MTDDFKYTHPELDPNSPKYNPELINYLRAELQPILDYIASHMDSEVAELFEQEITYGQNIQPFLKEELKKPQYGGKTSLELAAEADDGSGNFDQDSLWVKALTAAKAAYRETLSEIVYNDFDTYKTSTDKLHYEFYSDILLPKKGDIEGQFSLTTHYGKAPVMAAMTYNTALAKEKGFDQRVSPFDCFVASTLDNLYENNNTRVTISRIFHEMGNEGRISDTNRKKIKLSLFKLMTTYIEINDASVRNLKGKRPRNELLAGNIANIHFSMDPFIVNGALIDKKDNDGDGQIVVISDYTLFYHMAQDYKAFTSWSKRLLKRYTGTRNEKYYAVLLFLFRQIGWMKHASSSNPRHNSKIDHADLFEITGDTRKRDKDKTISIMHQLFDEAFVPEGELKAPPGKEKAWELSDDGSATIVYLPTGRYSKPLDVQNEEYEKRKAQKKASKQKARDKKRGDKK